MSFLGLGWFKSKEELEAEQMIYNQMIFPFGDKQKDKIIEILKELIENEEKENLIFNYVVTKQEMKNIDIDNISKNKLIDLTTFLNEHYINFNNDVYKYIALANSDIKISKSLKYPSIEKLLIDVKDIQDKLNK